MKEQAFHIPYVVLSADELSEADRLLVERAKEATYTSYAPYSHFSVGAAVMMANGEIISGSNQENAASPSGTCAERCTVFYAGARYPDDAVVSIAVAARNESGEFTRQPISPCGACRQVLAEVENRHHQPLRILLYGTEGTYLLEGIASLLPFHFSSESMDVDK